MIIRHGVTVLRPEWNCTHVEWTDAEKAAFAVEERKRKKEEFRETLIIAGLTALQPIVAVFTAICFASMFGAFR